MRKVYESVIKALQFDPNKPDEFRDLATTAETAYRLYRTVERGTEELTYLDQVLDTLQAARDAGYLFDQSPEPFQMNRERLDAEVSEAKAELEVIARDLGTDVHIENNTTFDPRHIDKINEALQGAFDGLGRLRK